MIAQLMHFMCLYFLSNVTLKNENSNIKEAAFDLEFDATRTHVHRIQVAIDKVWILKIAFVLLKRSPKEYKDLNVNT